MKLLVVGRNQQEANILLNSQYVSGYHAELILLDNGDIYLVDKSTNGTYVNGSRVTPAKETPIHRGDNVVFADQPLNWNMVPEIRMPADVVAIRSVGSNYMNDVKLNGAAASRFHATLMKKKDGKWYITDHSKNGTTVDGSRIPQNRPVQLKAGQEVACAGVPVDNPANAKSGSALKIVGIVAAALCLCVGLFFGIRQLLNGDDIIITRDMTNAELYQQYHNSVGLMCCSYHFEVECGTLNIGDLYDPDSWNGSRFTRGMYDEFVINGSTILEYDGSNSMPYTATGFFVGDAGHIVSNRHVACPWETDKLSQSTNVTMLVAAENYYKAKLTKLYEMGMTSALPYISQVKVVGVLDTQLISPDGEYLDEKNAFNCTVIAISETMDEDLAIFKVRTTSAIPGVKPIPINRIRAIEPVIGNDVFTMGYPMGLRLMDDLKNTPIQANSAAGNITRNDSKNTFGFDAVSYQGASGSPVFDRKGNLIGIVSRKMQDQNFNWAVRSEILENLLKKESLKK